VDIVAALTAITALVILFKIWQPSDEFHMEGEHAATIEIKQHGAGPVLLAWSPYLFLVFFVLLWGSGILNDNLFRWTQNDLGLIAVPWPGLHEVITRMPPAVEVATPYAATYNINWLSAAGTACALATILGAIVLRFPVSSYFKLLGSVFSQLAFSLITIGAIVGLAFLMNYSGATVTLGLAFATTGAVFPFFSAILGWLGVFLTGSDTSANALFGNLQVVTANQLGLDPAVMASANSAGGVMGKMISLQSLAVAVAATGMARSQEGDLFRFTIKHSIFLACILGGLSMVYAYVG
jgi:lactate permease